ncbi:MAG TPA: hypothetical protein VE861_12665 [Gemmatimonadaceae bacterium]|nr:hypothetical protein [Gemmatimonadaceae bacterium]
MTPSFQFTLLAHARRCALSLMFLAAASQLQAQAAAKRKSSPRRTTSADSTARDTTPARVRTPPRPPVVRGRNKSDSSAIASLDRDSVNDTRWPVRTGAYAPGALLPGHRVIAFYGNPLSRRMGILGELDPEPMLAKLDREVAAWRAADPSTPVLPALHLIVTVAQGSAGADGKWRARMGDSLIAKVLRWAETRNALMFIDIQVGKSTIQQELPVVLKWLERPNVHLGIDAEFSMKDGSNPGRRVGTYDARDINYVQDVLSDLVKRKNLPPKLLIIHRYTRPMITNYRNIRFDPHVQVVMHMDGWGTPPVKISSWRSYIQQEPVQFTGFKLFYKNDPRGSSKMMVPGEVLRLWPKPLYIQYQ